MSANATTPSTMGGPSYAQIFGPVFWGFCLSLMLCGVSTLQGYVYFSRYNDKLGIRLLAIMMLGLDFLSMALICQSMYYYMLSHFGSFAPLNAVTNELIVECLISAIITFTSQMYFSYQLYVVGSSGKTVVIMNALVILFGTIGLGGALGFVVLMFMHPHAVFMNRNHTFVILAGVAKGCDAAADIIATIAMCLFLKSAKTGVSKTSSLLRSLMHLVINRGLLVTAAQIILLITFFASSGHLYWLAVHMNTTKLYVNTFFGMLNVRTAMQDRYANGHMTLSASASAPIPNAYRRSLVIASEGRGKAGDLTNQNYPLGAIRITTSSTVEEL